MIEIVVKPAENTKY